MNICPETRHRIMLDFLNELIANKPISQYFKGIGFYVTDPSKMAQLKSNPHTPVSQEELGLKINLYANVPLELLLPDKYIHSTGQYPITTCTTGIFDPI